MIADSKKHDPTREHFGFIPYMAKSYLGHLLAESFCERIISHANIVLNKSNSCLNPEEMGQLVVLRMNRGFMKYARHKYGLAMNHPSFPSADPDSYIAVDPSVITAEEMASATLVRV